MKPSDERELAVEDRRMIDAVDAALRPSPMSPARKAAFHARLEQRIARRNRSWPWLASAFATMATAAAALWLIRPAEAPVVPASSEGSVLYAFVDSAALSTELTDASSYLPDDYLAIARLIEPEPAEP